MLDNLSFSRFKAYFRVLDPIRLPGYSGSVFHDALGRAFWNVRYNERKETCLRCPVRSECRYQNLRAYFFKAPNDHPFIKPNFERLDARMRSGRPNLPQPFVFDPVTGGDYDTGEFMALSFTLVGKAIECFPFMACALSLVGGREMRMGGGRVVLEAIVDGFSRADGGQTLIFDAKSCQLTGPCRVFDFDLVRDWAPDRPDDGGADREARLNFVTPFRYKVKGRLGAPLTFKIFINRLLDRLTLLSVHSPISFDIDRENLNSLAESIREVSDLEWFEFKRNTPSRYHKTPINLDGYIGKITFSGNLTPVFSFLKMGEFLNVGKAASFGHGKYELTIL